MEEDSSTRKILDLKKKNNFQLGLHSKMEWLPAGEKKIETEKRKAWTSTSLFVSCPQCQDLNSEQSILHGTRTELKNLTA